jgi:hypothetical protein
VDRYPNIADHGLNFPQAFSHLALTSAAINLDKMIDSGPGAVVPGADGAAAV